MWLKWSYADSPYNCYKHEEYFAAVWQLFKILPDLWRLDEDAIHTELAFRNEAMVTAMARLDAEDIFALNQPRDAIIVNVENQPLDAVNLANAKRLNSPEAMADWFQDNKGEFE